MQIDYLEPAEGSYRPGVCNIDRREIARRRAFGVAGVAVAAASGIVVVAIDAPPLSRLLILLPLWGGLVSLEQARRRFCAGFAYLGLRSVAGSDSPEHVTDAQDKAADRAAARWLVAYCGAIAAAITAIFIILPI